MVTMTSRRHRCPGAARAAPRPGALPAVSRGGPGRERLHWPVVPAPPADLARSQMDALVELVAVPPVADELAARFAAAGHRLYLVGGWVRDALLGRGSDGDADFTTDARPEAVLGLLEGWADAVWDTGIAFGTVGARRRGTTVEITTFRADAYDRVTRNPVVAFGESIEDDLVRRDFTTNAMAVELTGERTFVDPHGGLAALHAGVLDTPATPQESFATRSGCCAPRGSSRSWVSRRPRGSSRR
jgi:poly(A) polymerase